MNENSGATDTADRPPEIANPVPAAEAQGPPSQPASATRLSRVRFPRWTQMRLLGNIQFFKVSYAVLVAVPLLALLQHYVPRLPDTFRNMPLVLRLTYFSSLLLSCAHMVFQGFCPSIIRRFDSPNDLYRDLLQIMALQVQCLPEDKNFDFHIKHCRENFQRKDFQYWFARILCGFFYTTGIALFAIVIVIQALRVVGIFV
jgi:hypothetical protein